MIYLIVFLGGFILGFCVCSIQYSMYSASGVLQIDQTNPEKDIYRIEIDNIDDLSRKDRIILEVNEHASFSQK